MTDIIESMPVGFAALVTGVLVLVVYLVIVWTDAGPIINRNEIDWGDE